MKKLTALILVLMMVLAMVPALGADDLSGTWYIIQFQLTIGQMDLNTDGTMVLTAYSEEGTESFTGSWAPSENGIYMTLKNEETGEEQTEEIPYDGTNLDATEALDAIFTREPGKTTLTAYAPYLHAVLNGEEAAPPEGLTEEENDAILVEIFNYLLTYYGTDTEPAAETAPEAATETVEKAEEAVAGEAEIMSHEEYAAAAFDTEVTVETYVQATQNWWNNQITVYAQSPDGAYFIYNMPCSEEDAAKLVPGAKIRVKGFKAEWSGEVEIIDASFEFIEGEAFIAEAEDVTDKLGKDELINCQNELVAFKGMTVEAYDESGAAFAYKDAEGKTDDLYFKASKDGETYDFCVEFYLCGKDTEVYKAVEGLNVGDVIDLEGFLYWYNGMNPHITKITPAQ